MTYIYLVKYYQQDFPQSLSGRGFAVSSYLYTGLAQNGNKGKLGQGDLIRLIMIQAIPGDVKLGQVDLINSWFAESLFG